jgi:cathepsin B
MKRVLCVLALVAVATALNYKAPAVTQDLIDDVNNDPLGTWRAGWNNKFDSATLGDALQLCGTILETKPAMNVIDEVRDVPEEFDSRTNWPKCKDVIGHIRDQSVCGSCWAFGAAEAFTDRVCIATNGTNQNQYSATDVLSCCGLSCGFGCNGGYLSGAWGYIQSKGLVTGGEFGDKDCYPYVFEKCDHHVDGEYGPCGPTQPTPKCPNACQAGYEKPWAQDKMFAASHASISSKVEAIQTEIMTRGPIECAFTVYNDFLTYKSGVYQHVTGSSLGGHAIKVLGWGVENGTPYWLAANSWNEGWGDQGYFKILRGKNHCSIESQCHVGPVKL